MTYCLLNEDDAIKIYNIEEKSFSDGWNIEQIVSAFENGRYFAYGAFDKEVAVGFIGFSISLDTADIETICTVPEYRKRGIAKELFLKAQQFLKDNGVTKIFLEVRESNIPAINLYKANGFNKISIRKKYYSDGENAIVMNKEI